MFLLRVLATPSRLRIRWTGTCCRISPQKALRPRARCELAERAQHVHHFSERRAAGLVPLNRATLRYQHNREPQGHYECDCARRSAAGFVTAPSADGDAPAQGQFNEASAAPGRRPLDSCARQWSISLPASACCSVQTTALSEEKVAAALDVVVAGRGAPQPITVDDRTEFASKAMSYINRNRARQTGTNRTTQAETSWARVFRGGFPRVSRYWTDETSGAPSVCIPPIWSGYAQFARWVHLVQVAGPNRHGA
jgi:hypothetical protein